MRSCLKLGPALAVAVVLATFLSLSQSADAGGWRHRRHGHAVYTGYDCPGWYAGYETYTVYGSGGGSIGGAAAYAAPGSVYNYAYWGQTPGYPWYAAYGYPGPGFGYPGTPYSIPFGAGVYATPPTTLSVW